MNRLRLGTRSSALARAQSEWAAQRLREAHPGLEIEAVFIKTSGDRFSLSGKPSAECAPPDVKAMFVKEIEEALLRGEVDFGVHSSKDLPAETPEGLCIAAYPVREDPRDVFVPGSSPSWSEVPARATIGTASLRRQVQLRLRRPDILFEALRGNVDTRLRKLKEKGFAGLILAEAGLKRLGLESVRREILPEDIVIPAPGQGALAIEARQDREDVRRVLSVLDDRRSRLEVETERALLKAVGGGCSTPLGALARLEGETMALSVFWAREDGGGATRLSGRCGLAPAELAALVQDLRGRLPAA